MVEAGVADGGGAFVVPADAAGQRLVDVCRAHLGPIARRAVGPLIAEGALTVDGRAGRIAQSVAAGQRLHLAEGVWDRLTAAGLTTPPSPGDLDVVWADGDLLVVDKPGGLHVHPMGRYREDALLGRVLWHVGARPGRPWTTCRPSPAHRLDRPTSGLVLFARSIEVREVLQGLLERHEVVRTYRATVHGQVEGTSGVVEGALGRDPSDPRRRAVVATGGQPARSRWRVVARMGSGTTATTELELHLETGRTHQLRAHLAHLGHPIVGDVQYGAPAAGPPVDPRVGASIALRAVALALPHPRDGRPIEVHAPAHLSGR